MKQHVLYSLCVLACGLVLKGQDMHFSQFNENPSLINPALTGVNGLRASVNYKNQWKSVSTPFKTYGASFEMRSPGFSKKKEGSFGSRNPDDVRVGRFAAGLSVYKDRLGDGNLSLTQLNLSLSCFVPTGAKSQLSLGIQASYNQRRLDNTRFVFPNQFNGGAYDPSISSNENLGAQGFNYLDFAGGLLWSYGDEERRIRDHKQIKARVGFAAYHLTQPKQKYLANGTAVLPFKFVAHGDFHISIQNTNLAIAPSYLAQLQGASLELIAGAMLKYYLKNDTKYTGYVKRTSYGIGAYYRNQDAAIVYALLEWEEQYAVGLSYDVNISPLYKASAMRGGLELTLRYNVANSFLYQKMK